MAHIARRSAVVAALAAFLVSVAAPAWAHVTVHSDDPVRGASDALVMFRTPNEETSAAVTKLQVYFPTNHPLLDVLVDPHPGWHVTAKTSKLPHPVTTDDGKITSAVSEVTWTANSTASGLQTGEADDFVVTVGQLPSSSTATFRAIQTYSNGDVVKWIEVQAPGGSEPEHPAPVLNLSSPGQSAEASRAEADLSMPGMQMTETAPKHAKTAKVTNASASTERVTRGVSVAALVLALIGLGIALRPRSLRS